MSVHFLVTFCLKNKRCIRAADWQTQSYVMWHDRRNRSCFPGLEEVPRRQSQEVTAKCGELKDRQEVPKVSFPLSECVVLSCREEGWCWSSLPGTLYFLLQLQQSHTVQTTSKSVYISVNRKIIDSCLVFSAGIFRNASVVCSTLLIGGNSTSQIICDLWDLLIALGILVSFSLSRQRREGFFA